MSIQEKYHEYLHQVNTTSEVLHYYELFYMTFQSFTMWHGEEPPEHYRKDVLEMGLFKTLLVVQKIKLRMGH